jgi:inositol phosphorylceramide mannosyltransferase catalytic subunit
MTIFVLVLFLLRHHIRDLSEVATTYATFHMLVNRHSELVFRYPPAGDVAKEQELVPKIIHQILLTEGRNSSLSKYELALASCQDLHQNWTHHLWTDESAAAFMDAHYPNIAPHYRGYRQSIQRANILRDALLHHYGGVYLDLDVTCLRPLDNLLHLPWLTPG